MVAEYTMWIKAKAKRQDERWGLWDFFLLYLTVNLFNIQFMWEMSLVFMLLLSKLPFFHMPNPQPFAFYFFDWCLQFAGCNLCRAQKRSLFAAYYSTLVDRVKSNEKSWPQATSHKAQKPLTLWPVPSFYEIWNSFFKSSRFKQRKRL